MVSHMKPNDPFQAASRLVPIKIIFPYAVLTFLWIFFSNNILISLIHNPKVHQHSP